MTTKTTIRNNTKKPAGGLHPGMMGDGTEEQNLNERAAIQRAVSKRMR